VAEVVELYFEDSAGKVDKLEAKLAAPAPDFNEVDQLVHQFKGSSASFGGGAGLRGGGGAGPPPPPPPPPQPPPRRARGGAGRAGAAVCVRPSA